MKRKILFLFTLMLITVSVMAQDNPIDVIGDIKAAPDWTSLVGMYEIIAAAVVLILTQLGKIIPGLRELKGVYIAVLVTVVIVVAGIIKFGTGGLASGTVIWLIATQIFDKFFKPEKAKREFPNEEDDGM